MILREFVVTRPNGDDETVTALRWEIGGDGTLVFYQDIPQEKLVYAPRAWSIVGLKRED